MKKLNYFFKNALVAILFFVLAKIGLTFAFIQSNVTLFWLPSGFSVAILFLFGYRFTLGIAVGAFVANLTTNAPISFVLFATIANTLEPIISIYLAKTKFKIRPSLLRLKDIFFFLLFSVVVSPILSSIIGSIGLCLNGMLKWSNIGYAIASWWAGDAFGILTLGSLLLSWSFISTKPHSVKRFLEAILLFSFLCFIQFMIHFEYDFYISGKYLTWFVFPFLIWSAIRLEAKVSYLFAFIAMMIAVLGTVNGKGPFYTGEINSSLLLLYSFISIVMVNTMVLTATLYERREKENTIINLNIERDALFNNIDDLIWGVDRNYCLVTANNAFISSIQKSTGRILEIGNSLLDQSYYTKEILEYWRKLYDQGFSGEIVKTEFRTLDSEGPVGWISLIIKPIYKEKKIIGLACYGKDITEERKSEIELRRAKEEAESANAAKSQFISNMSHEIRTPLNAILGFSDLLKSTHLNEIQIKYVNTILQSGNLLLVELNDLLDFGQLYLGKIQLQMEKVDLISVLDQVTEIHKLKLKKNIKLKLKISEKTPHYIYTDSIRLRQILIHLLSNAIKFTDSGDVVIEVTHDAMEPMDKEATLLFSIRDTGIGISKENQTQIINFFSQVDQSNVRQYGGIGLGLPITNKILQLMDSHLEINSELGKGSEFFFKLRVKIGEPEEASKILPSLAILKEKPIQILVADDDEINLMLIRTIISRILPKAKLSEVSNGKKAVSLCQNNQFNLIFLDIQMPEMDGYDATRKIRELENYKETPIIAVTAGVTDSTRDTCFKVGMNDYASKPFTKEKIEDLILKWGYKIN
ncbi:MAG TPA: MASE1 domain-containing protein [Leptospiraceae bacterium]|nr:MASE1 domain-containing protein [Leptospiraceae bacterium]HMW08215.1 MASE1 domain-containing protein [Leptospiraceae bacterium]HMX34404.1 MASE1 domain-containing protein [Leptospiraceae bacterium]HMZ64627.1 MASE1 domain-containing protein [Leptospiraceae bacterium]HNA09105.1 MASE1 domain-containing protein [Leptospiraceae bacterium]